MSDLVWFKLSAEELRANISVSVVTGWVDRFRRGGDQKFRNANARESQFYFESVKQSKLLFCYINRFELHCCGILGVAFGLWDEIPPSGLAIDSEINYAVLSAREETCEEEVWLDVTVMRRMDSCLAKFFLLTSKWKVSITVAVRLVGFQKWVWILGPVKTSTGGAHRQARNSHHWQNGFSA